MFKGLLSHIREFGAVNAPLYWLDRALGALSAGRIRLIKYYLVAQPVPEKPLLPPGRGANIEVEYVDRNDYDEAELIRPPQVLRERFAQGGKCLGARKAGTLVGFLWYNHNAYDEDEVRCRFIPRPAASTVWDYDVFVHPKHRLGIVFARLWDTANAEFRACGIKWTLSRISPFNPGSLASHARLGTQRIASATFLKLGPVQAMVATAPPYAHLSLRGPHGPELRLTAPQSD